MRLSPNELSCTGDRRLFQMSSTYNACQESTLKLDVAVLGGGFAGVYCAKSLAKAMGHRSQVKVGLISEENYMVFQPMLPEVAGASISPRHVVNPLRLLCRHAQVFRGKVETIDWPDRSLVLNAGPFSGNLRIRYQHLVLALGAVTDLSRIPGMPEHSLLIKTVGDAMHLRATLLARIEEANIEPRPDVKRRLLTFVVVGGGYSGVETAGHLLDMFRDIRVYYPNVSEQDFEFCLIHSQDHLLPTLSRSLGEYSARKLKARGLRLILNQRVKSITASRVYLQDGSTIETNTVISTVGNAPHPLIKTLCKGAALQSQSDAVLVEPTGQAKGQSQIWAVGDCAAFPAVAGGSCPPTAQFAMRQGILVGKNIARQIQGQPLQPFSFKGLGEMASIGHHEAVADILGFKFSGFLAWWLWRSVYLLKLPSFDRKVRVMLDWTLDLFFPRDLNHLSPRFTKPVTEIHLEPGDILFQRDEPAFSFYVVKSGALEIVENGVVIQRIVSGGYLGEQALLGDGVWHYDARATEPTGLASISASSFHQLVSATGSLSHFFQKSASKYQSREIIEAIGRKFAPEFAAMPVSRLMETKLHTLTPQMTVQQAVQITREHPRSTYPVVDQDRKLLGSITREDFYEFLKRENTLPATLIQQVPLANLPTVIDSTSVRDVMICLIRAGSNLVLVVDVDNHLKGIATVIDLLAAGGITEPATPSEARAQPQGI